MSNDENKKRWRVGYWHMRDAAEVDVALEAQRFEDELNKLDDEDYEIYEVSFDKRMVVGRRKEEELSDEEAARFAEELRREDRKPPSFFKVLFGGTTDPESEESDEDADEQADTEPPPPPPPAADEAVPQIQGRMSVHLLNAAVSIGASREQGDPYTKDHVEKVYRQLFMRAPRDEVEKSLSDLREYRKQHASCAPDSPCGIIQTCDLVEARLQKHLDAHPLN